MTTILTPSQYEKFIKPFEHLLGKNGSVPIDIVVTGKLDIDIKELEEIVDKILEKIRKNESKRI